MFVPYFVVTFNHQDTMAHEFLPKRSFNLDLELRRGAQKGIEGGKREAGGGLEGALE